jgi:hypothetical protein
VAFAGYMIFVILHAVVGGHPETGVFWSAIALLGVLALISLLAVRRLTRSGDRGPSRQT